MLTKLFWCEQKGVLLVLTHCHVGGMLDGENGENQPEKSAPKKLASLPSSDLWVYVWELLKKDLKPPKDDDLSWIFHGLPMDSQWTMADFPHFPSARPVGRRGRDPADPLRQMVRGGHKRLEAPAQGLPGRAQRPGLGDGLHGCQWRGSHQICRGGLGDGDGICIYIYTYVICIYI